MLIALGCVTLLALAAIALCVILLRSQSEERAQHALERRELLTRIQRPEIVPAMPLEEFKVPEREPDEYHRVGAIEMSDAWLRGEDPEDG